MVIPVITFPTAFIYPYSQLIIPEFSAYLAKKNYKSINYIINKIFKIISNFSFCICSIFWIFSNQIGLVIYNNVESSYYFKIMSPLIIFMYMDHIVDSVLKGLNRQFGVMVCNIIDLSITICIMYFLLPLYGIKAYIFSLFFSEILNFCISFYQMIKYSKINVNIYDWLFKPLFCSLFSYICILNLKFNFSNLSTYLISNIILFIFYYLFFFIIFNKFYLLFKK